MSDPIATNIASNPTTEEVSTAVTGEKEAIRGNDSTGVLETKETVGGGSTSVEGDKVGVIEGESVVVDGTGDSVVVEGTGESAVGVVSGPSIEEESEDGDSEEEGESEDDERSVEELLKESRVALRKNFVWKAYHMANVAVIKGVRENPNEVGMSIIHRHLYLNLGQTIIALLEKKGDILEGSAPVIGEERVDEEDNREQENQEEEVVGTDTAVTQIEHTPVPEGADTEVVPAAGTPGSAEKGASTPGSAEEGATSSPDAALTPEEAPKDVVPKEDVAPLEEKDMEGNMADLPTEDDVWMTLEIARSLYGKVLKDVKGDYGELPVPTGLEFIRLVPNMEGLLSVGDTEDEQKTEPAKPSIFDNVAKPDFSATADNTTEGSKPVSKGTSSPTAVPIAEEKEVAVPTPIKTTITENEKVDGFYSWIETFEFKDSFSTESVSFQKDVEALSTCYLLLGDLLLVGDHFEGARLEYERSFYVLIYYGYRSKNLKDVLVPFAQSLLWTSRPKDALSVYKAAIRLYESLVTERGDDCATKSTLGGGGTFSTLIEDLRVEVEAISKRPSISGDGAHGSNENSKPSERVKALKTALGDIETKDAGTTIGFSSSTMAGAEVQEMAVRRKRGPLEADNDTDKRVRTE